VPGRIAAAGGATLAAVVLLLGYPTSSNSATPVKPLVVATGSAPTPDGAAGPATTDAATTVAGSVAQTRWGPVQVQITVSGGKVVAADVLQVPSGNRRDQEINAYAVPALNAEGVQAGSAQIDTVSGATVTSQGYIESLPAALDAAHLS
jgi:uncharacterized protein with FMN-binding domain